MEMDYQQKNPCAMNYRGIATSGAMRAALENCQNEDGTIAVPKVLVPYMNGKKVIGKRH